MNTLNISEHAKLLEYKDTMSRIINSMYPEMNREDIDRAVNYSIQKRFKNFNLQVHNNYTSTITDLTALEMLDYIERRGVIKTSYGTMFRTHESVPNPLGKVIQNFLDLRKLHKKEMFKYPKGSEMFEKFNLLQNLD